METNKVLSACGLWCDECEHFKNQCDGCHSIKGSTFWAKEMMPSKICPLYDCGINTRAYKNCGDCAELPCELFVKMKDPNSSEVEHQRMLKVRQERLNAK